MNADRDLDISDGITILNYLFLGDAPPPEPGPPGPGEACGPDPDEPGSSGDLGCEDYGNC